MLCLVAQLCSTLAIPWTVAHQAPPSMGFPRQEYWSGLPCPLPGDLPNPRIKAMSLASPPLLGGLFTTQEALCLYKLGIIPFFQMRKIVAQRNQAVVQEDPTRSSHSRGETQSWLFPNCEISQWHSSAFYTILKTNLGAHLPNKHHLEQGSFQSPWAK